jgi:hypothetical protein
VGWLLPDLEWVSFAGKSGWVLGRLFKTGFVIAEGVLLVYVASSRVGLPEIAEGVDIFGKKFKNMLSQSKD